AIYDHFADRMIHQPIAPSPDLWQSLRQQLASAAKYSPWLARAIARASDVSERMDLDAAARAATVIESLDQIAESNLEAFVAARSAVMAGSLSTDAKSRLEPEQLASIEKLQARHSDLLRPWTEGRLSARELRTELVRFYEKRGQQQVDERFFKAVPRPHGAADEDRRAGRGDSRDLDR
ncbi:MAG: hypothetical protein JJ992_19975, partial [Planctomycetes bacterium]|nr:hypothetical protein [Planctomycetota bacterium]